MVRPRMKATNPQLHTHNFSDIIYKSNLTRYFLFFSVMVSLNHDYGASGTTRYQTSNPIMSSPLISRTNEREFSPTDRNVGTPREHFLCARMNTYVTAVHIMLLCVTASFLAHFPPFMDEQNVANESSLA